MRLLYLLLLFALSAASFAGKLPKSLPHDDRLKVVAFDTNDVVTIKGCHLISTSIQFSKDEKITNVDIGDPLAWSVSVNKSAPYLLSVKPTLPTSNTNMTITTDAHLYRFQLLTSPTATSTSKDVTYAVQFHYPDEEKARLTQRLSALQHSFFGFNPKKPMSWNDHYTYVGAPMLAPVKALDNGAVTVFEFKEHGVIPAIFAVDRFRNESLVNFHVQGNTVYIQKVAHQFTLRSGSDVTTVYNEQCPV